MRPDQLQRLEDLSERLTEIVLEEADPDTWPGAGVPLANLDVQTRGDRYWSKKNAAATLSLVLRVEQVATNMKETIGRDPRDETEIDKEIDKAEREAAKLLDKVAKAANKHGKAKT